MRLVLLHYFDVVKKKEYFLFYSIKIMVNLPALTTN